MLRTLIGLECRRLLGINAFLHSPKNSSIRRHSGMNLTAYVLAAGVLSLSIAGQTAAMVQLGAVSILPAMLVTAGSLMVLMVSVYGMGERLYSTRGLETLRAMPVRIGMVALSRMLAQYLSGLLLTVVLLLPAVLVLGILTRQNPGYYGIMAAALAGLPLIPLSVSALVGTAILAAASKSRHPVAVRTVLSVILMAALLAGPMLGQPIPDFSRDEALLRQELLELLPRMLWYPPAKWVGESALHGKAWGIAGFLLLSLGCYAGTAVLIIHHFDRICSRLSANHSRGTAHLGKLRSTSPLKALYLRECRRYFASPVYVSNTIVAPIIALAAAAALLFVDLEPIERVLPIPAAVLAPVAWAMVCCLMPACSVAVSMEGRQIWQIKTLPVSTKIWLDSKLLWGLTLMLPSYLLSELFMTVALKPGLWELLWQLGAPLVLMAFSCTFAIAADLRLHNFLFEKDEIAVKQSLSALVGGIGGPLAALMSAGLLIALGGETPAKLLVLAAVCAGAAACYGCSIRKRMETI